MGKTWQIAQLIRKLARKLLFFFKDEVWGNAFIQTRAAGSGWAHFPWGVASFQEMLDLLVKILKWPWLGYCSKPFGFRAWVFPLTPPNSPILWHQLGILYRTQFWLYLEFVSDRSVWEAHTVEPLCWRFSLSVWKAHTSRLFCQRADRYTPGGHVAEGETG